jgi:hypothetical protein
MYLISILKRENRRSGKERRKAGEAERSVQENRNPTDRRGDRDRRDDIGRRSGIYYKLSDRKKGTVDSIIDLLEYENLKKK